MTCKKHTISYVKWHEFESHPAQLGHETKTRVMGREKTEVGLYYELGLRNPVTAWVCPLEVTEIQIR